MSKHTPGPWVFSSLIVRAAGNGYEVARVHCNFKIRGKEGREEYEYAQGNAHLIATAPEMLEALKEAALQIEYLHGKFKETGSGNATLARVQDAIAKAEGRK